MPLFAPEERVGTTVGERYRINRLLATGGMGVVYEGEHLGTGRSVAVKMLKAQFALEKEANFRFLREARAAAALSHPNIIEVIDVGEAEDGTAYQVLELLDGQPLTEWINQRTPLETEWVLDALLPVMDALHSAHSRGVIHRDLKPDNIYISRNGIGELVPKVLDFGIAKFGDSSISGAMPMGSIMGTPQYMAPEQASGRPNIGVPADIWAMAVVMLEAFAGVHPAEGEGSTTLLIRIATRGLPSAMNVCPRIHSALAAAIDRGLAFQPEDRWSTMAEFCEATYEAALRAKVAGHYVPVSHRSIGSKGRRPSGAVPIFRSSPRSSSRPPSAPPRTRRDSSLPPSGLPSLIPVHHENAQPGPGSQSKLRLDAGQRVTAVRPYGHSLRTRVFEHLHNIGLVVDDSDTIPVGTGDDEAVEQVVRSRNKILLVSFHGHRDELGRRVDGLNFIRKLDRACRGRFRWRIIMPTSALGAASVALALSREPIRPEVKRAILVIHEDELTAEDLTERIQRHVQAA